MNQKMKVPTPSIVVMASRLAFDEADAAALQKILRRNRNPEVSSVALALRLGEIAREYVAVHAIEERTQPRETTAFCEYAAKTVEQFQALMKLLVDNPDNARVTLMVELLHQSDALALLSSPDVVGAAGAFVTSAREAADHYRRWPSRPRELNAIKPENYMLLTRLVDVFAWAFDAPRPAPEAHASNLVFRAATAFAERLARKLKADDDPVRVTFRDRDAAKNAARSLDHFRCGSMAGHWRRNHGMTPPPRRAARKNETKAVSFNAS
jgi:hypothetical protein